MKIIALIFFLIFSSCVYAQIVPPYFDDFEGVNPGWTVPNNPQITAWALGLPGFGQTSGCHSGTNCWDVNLNNSYHDNANTILRSPIFDFTNCVNASVSFWQNRNTEAEDGTRMDYSIDTGLTWQTLDFTDPNKINWHNSISLGQTGWPAWESYSAGHTWIRSSYNLNFLSGAPSVRFRFVFISDNSVEGDGMSIDDFSIITPPAQEAGVKEIYYPVTTPVGTASPVNLRIHNFGSDTITTITLAYNVNNGADTSFTTALNLIPNADTILFFPFNFSVPTGPFIFKAWTSLTGDTIPSNDTAFVNLNGIPTVNLPYFNDFESDNGIFYCETPEFFNTQWQYGLPTYGDLTGAYSGVACWDINLNNRYQSNAFTYLYTPQFNFDSTAINPEINFWQNRDSRHDWDGFYLEYSINEGPWNLLGTVNDSDGVNWYNGNIIWLPQQVWDGNPYTWIKSSHSLKFLRGAGLVQFRFIFRSYTAQSLGGASIDNFAISFPTSTDAELRAVNPGDLNFKSGISPDINFKIRNTGTDSISNFTSELRINGILQSSILTPQALGPNDVASLIFPGYTVPIGAYSLSASVSLSGDTIAENDTLTRQGIGVDIYTPAYSNDFEAGNIDWISEFNGDTGCYCIKRQWELKTPTCGFTSGAHSGTKSWCMNCYQANDYSKLYSPYFDISSTVHPKLRFWHEWVTSTNAGVRIDYQIDQDTAWYVLGFTPNDPNAVNWYNISILTSTNAPAWQGNSNGWKYSTYELDALPSASIIRFRYVFKASNSSANKGYCIDDFEITGANSNDANMYSISSPDSITTSGIPQDVWVTLKNVGANTLTSLDIIYTNNNGAPITYNWSGNLPVDSTVMIQLQQVIPSVGYNTLKVYVDWAADQDHSNDTAYYNYNAVLYTTVPYTDDFESGNLGWFAASYGAPTTNWEFGLPNYNTTSSAHSGNTCWDINLNTGYTNSANAHLYSPVFDYSNVTISQISFWLSNKTNLNDDVTYIEYSLNDSAWIHLGELLDTNGVDWYNTIQTNSTRPCWSGYSLGWKYRSLLTGMLNGNSRVQFRFVFMSDPFGSANVGVSMDDFMVVQNVGIHENDFTNSWNLVPNPARDEISVQLPLLTGISTIRIMDISGKEIMAKIIQPGQQNSILYIAIAQLNPGVYILKLENNGYSSQKLFVKE